MDHEINYTELIQIHSELASDAVTLLNLLNSNVIILPKGITVFMPKLLKNIERLIKIEHTDWLDENSEDFTPDYVPELLDQDCKRFSPYEEIFEEWCDAFEIELFGTDKKTIIQTLSYVVGDCAEFFADLSSMYPYVKDDED